MLFSTLYNKETEELVSLENLYSSKLLGFLYSFIKMT
jgi:hypothetical protein